MLIDGLELKPRKSRCDDCGFYKKTAIAGNIKEEIVDFISSGRVFPCHQDLETFSGSENEGTEDLVNHCKRNNKTLYCCKGHIEAMSKSPGSMPDIINILSSELVIDNNSKDVMTIDESIKFHLGGK